MAFRNAKCPPSFIMYLVPTGASKCAKLWLFSNVIRL